MTPEFAILIATIGWLIAVVAIAVAFRAAYRAERAFQLSARVDERTAALAKDAIAKQFMAGPSREERIAWARGRIQACVGVELSLEAHAGDPGAAMMLATARHNAALAKAELRMLGVEA